MAIELIGKIKPKNNGTFSMVDACDVEMPDGRRLSDMTLSEDAASFAVFDLVALGLPTLDAEGGMASLEMDTTEIGAAMRNGIVQFVLNVEYRGVTMTDTKVTVNPGNGIGMIGLLGYPIFLTFDVTSTKIVVSCRIALIHNIPPNVEAADNGKFLRVVDGAWAAVEEDTAEDGLPTVTTEDNGKILRVTDGVWAAVSLASAEEASF